MGTGVREREGRHTWNLGANKREQGGGEQWTENKELSRGCRSGGHTLYVNKEGCTSKGRGGVRGWVVPAFGQHSHLFCFSFHFIVILPIPFDHTFK